MQPLTPQPNMPNWSLQGTQQQQPQQPPGGFDIMAFINMMQQMQGQKLQQRQQMHTQDSALGSVATANSRPPGLTDSSAWERQFPTRPSGAGFDGGMGYAPPTMSNEDAAIGASQPQPNAAMLRSMPAQNPFIGQPNLVNPPRAQQPQRRGASFGF